MRLSKFSSWIVGALVALPISVTSGCSDDDKNGNGNGDVTDTGSDTSDSDTDSDTTSEPDTGSDSSDVADTDTDTDTDSDIATDTDTDVDTDTDTDIPGPEPIPEPNIVPDESNCSTVPNVLNIYDLQNVNCPNHPYPEPVGNSSEVSVDLRGVIVTAVFDDTWTVQDPRSGPYSGIAIFTRGQMAGAVEVGDVINVTGSYSEYYENSQIYLREATIVGTAPVPAPYVPAHPSHVGTNGPLAEAYEGVLVSVENVVVTHTHPDCPFDYGDFELNQSLRVDDKGYRWISTELCTTRSCARYGDTFSSITGPMLYDFGNHKILPRTEADVQVITRGAPEAVTKCTATDCREPENAFTTREIIINEIMADPYGPDTHAEWIELYNPSNESVNLNGWVIRDCGTQEIMLTGPDAVIRPRGYLVIGASKDRSLNGNTPVGYEYGAGNFYLSNTVGSVLLYSGQELGAPLVDHARYSRFDAWSSVFVPARSIERRSSNSDGTKVEAWKTATKVYGDGNRGTPGASNN